VNKLPAMNKDLKKSIHKLETYNESRLKSRQKGKEEWSG